MENHVDIFIEIHVKFRDILKICMEIHLEIHVQFGGILKIRGNPRKRLGEFLNYSAVRRYFETIWKFTCGNTYGNPRERLGSF